MATVTCPSHWTPSEVADFTAQLSQFEKTDDVFIDVRYIDFVWPFGTLLMAESVRQFAARRKSSGLQTRIAGVAHIASSRAGALSYLKHFGFFKFIGLQYGKAPGEAPGSDRYLPITVVKFDEIAKGNPGERWHVLLQSRCKEWASVLVSDEFSRTMIGYCLQEVVRNVFEHANVGYCVVMAQKYPASKSVEVTIVDTGRGIVESLQEVHTLESPAAAITHALLPGVSRALDLQSPDPWANSGFGLYVLSEMGRQFGQFEICSSGTLQSWRGNHEIIKPINFRGTGIGIRVSYADAEYFSNLLRSITVRGEEEAFNRTGVRHSASMSTLGLWE